MHTRSHAPTAIAVGAGIVMIQVAIAYLTYRYLPDWPTHGQFGDVFGAANALFSGLAFAGLIYTMLLQREDLGLQRRELELTREELSRTARAQEQSEVALRAQAEASSQSARLATATALLEHYQARLKLMQGFVVPGDSTRQIEQRELQRRIEALIRILDGMYAEVTAIGVKSD